MRSHGVCDILSLKSNLFGEVFYVTDSLLDLSFANFGDYVIQTIYPTVVVVVVTIIDGVSRRSLAYVNAFVPLFVVFDCADYVITPPLYVLYKNRAKLWPISASC